MQRSKRIALHMIAVAALAVAAGGCSSDLSLNNLTLVPKPETLMRKPDWATFSGGKADFTLRPVTPADLVNADGQCAAAPEQATGFAEFLDGRGGAAQRRWHLAANDGMRRGAAGRAGRKDRCQRR